MIYRMSAVSACGLLVSALWLCAADAQDQRGFAISGEEQALLDMTNQARAKEHLPPLKPNGLLFDVARGHSANMARQREMNHLLDERSPLQRVHAAGYPAGRVGENIAYSEALDVPEIFYQWMKSPRHRENILGEDFEEIGIGLATNGQGEVFYTQVFGTERRRR